MWEDFVDIFQKQFRDLAIELVHEKKMGDIKMGSDPCMSSFGSSNEK